MGGLHCYSTIQVEFTLLMLCGCIVHFKTIERTGQCGLQFMFYSGADFQLNLCANISTY